MTQESNDLETQQIYNICEMFSFTVPKDQYNTILLNLNFEHLTTGAIMSAMRSTYSHKSNIKCWTLRLKQAVEIVKERGEDPEEVFRGLTQFLTTPKKNTIIHRMFMALLHHKQYDAVHLVLRSLKWWELSAGEIYFAISTCHPYKQHIQEWNSALDIGARAINHMGLDGATILQKYTKLDGTPYVRYD